MAPLVAMTCAGFSGYAVLLTVAPLWAVEGGASTAGSGLVNGVLLLFTVMTQLLVPRALRSFGWGPVLAVGLALLGVPGIAMSLSDELGVILALSAALGRWRVGVFADRQGPQRFLVPLVPLTGVGMGLVAWSVAGSGGVRVGAFLVAMLVIGLCYGGLQNLTLLVSFSAVSRRHHNLASAVWNVGFDAGTALGSVAVGVIAGLTSFATAFLVAGAIAVATLPLALRRPAGAAARTLRR
jgi:hypothetical protein